MSSIPSFLDVVTPGHPDFNANPTFAESLSVIQQGVFNTLPPNLQANAEAQFNSLIATQGFNEGVIDDILGGLTPFIDLQFQNAENAAALPGQINQLYAGLIPQGILGTVDAANSLNSYFEQVAGNLPTNPFSDELVGRLTTAGLDDAAQFQQSSLAGIEEQFARRGGLGSSQALAAEGAARGAFAETASSLPIDLATQQFGFNTEFNLARENLLGDLRLGIEQSGQQGQALLQNLISSRSDELTAANAGAASAAAAATSGASIAAGVSAGRLIDPTLYSEFLSGIQNIGIAQEEFETLLDLAQQTGDAALVDQIFGFLGLAAQGAFPSAGVIPGIFGGLVTAGNIGINALQNIQSGPLGGN